jgi:hypothetical protein
VLTEDGSILDAKFEIVRLMILDTNPLLFLDNEVVAQTRGRH